MKKNKTLVLCVVGIMSAMSTVIYLLFPEIPLVPGVEYLKIDFSDIPAVITALVVNPFAGVLVEVVKNAIHLLRTTTFGIGEIMNTGIGTAMILTLTAFLKLFSKKLKKGLLNPMVYFLSAAISLAETILAGWLLNALLTPIFFVLMGIPVTAKAVFAGVVGSTLLNTVKAAVNVLLFYPVYFAVYKALPSKMVLTK